MPDKHRKSTLKSEIDANLKRVYDSVLQEEVPDQFKELLDRLRAKDTKPEQPR
jgi:hypothetical protein